MEAPLHRMRRRTAATALWCLWAALLLGMPYALQITEPYSPVSFSDAYGYLAVGVAAGLWAATLPGVRGRFCWPHPAAKTLLAAGLLLCGATLVVECVKLGYLNGVLSNLRAFVPGRYDPGSGTPDLGPFEAPVSALLHALVGSLAFLGRLENPLALLEGAACSLCGWTLLSWPPSAGGRPYAVPAPTRRTSRTAALVLALGALAGVTRCFAWSLCQPHPPYPLNGQVWIFLDPWLGISPELMLPVLFCGTLAAASAFWSHASASHGLGPVAILVPYCAGELAVRLAARVYPALFAVTALQAWIALALHVAAVAGVAAVCVAALRREHAWVAHPIATSADSSAGIVLSRDPFGDPDAPVSPVELRRALPDASVAALRGYGLTEVEVDALRGAALRLPSAEVASLLGVKAPTARVHLAHARAKLGVATTDEALSLALTACGASDRDQRGHTPHPGVGTIVAPRWLGVLAALGLVGLLAVALLLLLPYGNAALLWDMTWETAFGIALGLALPCLGRFVRTVAVGPRSPFRCAGGRGRAASVVPTLATVACCALGVAAVLVCRLSPAHPLLATSARGAAFAIAGTAVLVTGSVLLARRLVRIVQPHAAGGGVASRGLPHCAAALVACALPTLIALAAFGRSAWLGCLAAALVACLAGVCSAVVDAALGWSGRSGRPDPAPAVCRTPARSGRLLGAFVCTVGIGVCLEELWRGRVYASMTSALTPFAVLLAVLLAYLAVRWRRPARTGALAVVASGIALGVLEGVGFAATACCLMLGLAALTARAGRPSETDGVAGDRGAPPTPTGGIDAARIPDLGWHGPATAAALGCVLGVYLGNFYGLYLLAPLGNSLLGPNGNAAAVMPWIVTGIFLAALTLTAVLLVADHRQAGQRRSSRPSGCPDGRAGTTTSH